MSDPKIKEFLVELAQYRLETLERMQDKYEREHYTDEDISRAKAGVVELNEKIEELFPSDDAEQGAPKPF